MPGTTRTTAPASLISITGVAARAIVASVLLHASLAVAFTSGARGGARAGDRGLPVESDLIEITSPEIVLDEPRQVTAPEEHAPFPSFAKPAVRDPVHATKGVSLHPAKVAFAGGEGPPGQDAPPAVAAAPTSAPARFVMAIGAATTGTATSGTGAGTSTGGGDGAGDTYTEAGVSSRAHLLGGRPPDYPVAARTAGGEAAVPLEIVVSSSGVVVDARPLQHVGYGLDEAALRAVRAYRFVPARREGREVAVRMRWVVDFRLD